VGSEAEIGRFQLDEHFVLHHQDGSDGQFALALRAARSSSA